MGKITTLILILTVSFIAQIFADKVDFNIDLGNGRYLNHNDRNNDDRYTDRDYHHDRYRTIRIDSATYGGNCHASNGNITWDVAQYCNNQLNCDYVIDHRRIGDPAVGCAKDFVIQYSCGREAKTAYVRPEASGQIARIDCRGGNGGGGGGGYPPTPYKTVNVVSATYGGNCGAYQENMTQVLAQYCYNQTQCNYFIDHRVIGDPAAGCAKDFVVRYQCGNELRSEFVSSEASGKWISLNCNTPNNNPYPREFIQVYNASYGPRNVTNFVASDCNGKSGCEFVVDLGRLGDPAPGYAKDFRVSYQCGYNPNPKYIYLDPEAYGKKAYLQCN